MYIYIYIIYVRTLCKLDGCTLCRRKVAVRQSCHTAALPIVLPSLCLLSPFCANNGNGRLSLDCYFMHQQRVIQHLSRWRSLSVNLQTIRMLNSWPLRIAPAHSRVGVKADRLAADRPRKNAAERRKPLKSVLHGCRATILFCITHLHSQHVLCAMPSVYQY